MLAGSLASSKKEDVDFTLLRPYVDATIAAVSLYKVDDLKEVRRSEGLQHSQK